MDTPVKTNLENWIEGCLKGNEASQYQLFKYLYGKMLVVVKRYINDEETAKDVFQDAYLKVYHNLHLYAGQGSFEGWVRRIMVNASIDFLRRQKMRFVEMEDDKVNALADREDHTVFEGDEEEFQIISADEILELVQNLSTAYRTVFNLYVIEGLQHKEIAEKLGISEGTSKSNLSKARMYLKKSIQQRINAYNEQ